MRHAAQILVVDDDLAANTALCALLADVGFVVSAAANGDDALERYESLQPELVLTDLQMPGLDGIELVKRIQALEDPAAVIVMTAFATIGTAIEAIRAGASEYITKPIELEHLLVLIEKALTVRALRRDARRPSMPRLRMVGSSPMMDHIFEVVDQVASSRASVLIFGESGTGKELVANALHERSPRAGARFVKVHCAALSESLLESELFGHERGAFTGAHERKEGRFEIADGGTLFLDEIGDISPSTQVKLLRFLQEHEFERVGGNQTIRVDVRILAATNRNLAADVASGRFREDLYYRLKVVEITMPSLRERRSDVPALAQHFLRKFAAENNKAIDGFSPECLELLCAYAWPGNVRELEHAVESAVVFSTSSIIEAHCLPREVNPVVTRSTRPMIPGASLADIERYAILETLTATGGSSLRAGKMLQISPRTIQYRLHQYSQAPRSAVDAVAPPIDDTEPR